MLKQFLAKSLRFFFNWEINININEDCVVLFHHTSYIDSLPLFMTLDHPKMTFSKIIALPQIFNSITGPIARYFQFIPSARLEDKSTGMIQKFKEEFKHLQSERDKSGTNLPVSFFISPKGTIQRRDWRTGYYHLAKELQVPIYVVNIHWDLRKVMFFHVIDLDELNLVTETSVKEKIKKTLALPIPFNPQNSEIKLEHDETALLKMYDMLIPVDLCILSLIFFFPALITLYLRYKPVHAALLQCTIICSYLYHKNNENRNTDYGNRIHTLDMVYSISTILCFTFTTSYISWYAIFLASVASFFFIVSCPRGCSHQRGRYALLHPMFHIFSGLLTYETTRYIF